MIQLLLAASLASAQGFAYKKEPKAPDASEIPASAGGVLNLGCVSALAAIGHSDLAGVFSFISEKDSAVAFADFLARNKQAMKRYLRKLDDEVKTAAGITHWDHEVVVKTLEFFASPLAETVDKPAFDVNKKLNQLSMAPTMTLEEMTARKLAAKRG